MNPFFSRQRYNTVDIQVGDFSSQCATSWALCKNTKYFSKPAPPSHFKSQSWVLEELISNHSIGVDGWENPSSPYDSFLRYVRQPESKKKKMQKELLYVEYSVHNFSKVKTRGRSPSTSNKPTASQSNLLSSFSFHRWLDLH